MERLKWDIWRSEREQERETSTEREKERERERERGREICLESDSHLLLENVWFLERSLTLISDTQARYFSV